MELKSITYTSRAHLNVTSGDLETIHRSALELNPLDGISGILIFNGVQFLQIIEGPDGALDDLMRRLRGDPRHFHIELRDDRFIEERSFGGWSMKLVRVSASYFEATETIRDSIPPSVPDEVRARIFQLTEEISGTVRLHP